MFGQRCTTEEMGRCGGVGTGVLRSGTRVGEGRRREEATLQTAKKRWASGIRCSVGCVVCRLGELGCCCLLLLAGVGGQLHTEVWSKQFCRVSCRRLPVEF